MDAPLLQTAVTSLNNVWLSARQSTYNYWMDYTDIHGAQRMNPNDFGDPLTFHPAPTVGGFHLSSEISQHPQDGLARRLTFVVLSEITIVMGLLWIFGTDIYIPQSMTCNNSGGLAPSSDQILHNFSQLYLFSFLLELLLFQFWHLHFSVWYSN